MFFNQYREVTTRIPSKGVLRFDSAGMYAGVEICNHLRKVLYVMCADGNVHMLVPKSEYQYTKDTSPKIYVKVDARFDSELVEGMVQSMDSITGRKTDVYTIKINELYTIKGIPNAIYIPQANVSVSLLNDPILLKQAHPYLATSVNYKYIGDTKITVNIHDTSINYVYIKDVAGMSKLLVTHDRSKPEYIDIKRYDENNNVRLYRLEITADVDLQCVDVGYKRFGLVIGVSSEKVRERFDELHDKISDELYLAKKKIDSLIAELNVIKQENAVLKKQVDSAIKKEEEIHEIKVLKLKSSIADAEYARTKARIDADNAIIPLQLEKDIQKLHAEIAITNSKLATVESDNKSQTYKSFASVAESIVILCSILSKVSSPSKALMFGGLGALPFLLINGCVSVTKKIISFVRESFTGKDSKDTQEASVNKEGNDTQGVDTAKEGNDTQGVNVNKESKDTQKTSTEKEHKNSPIRDFYEKCKSIMSNTFRGILGTLNIYV